MKLTHEQIEEIRKRAEAATPETWVTNAYNSRQDIPALLAHIAKIDTEAWYWRNESSHWQKKSEDYYEKGKRLFDERNMWKGLRLEAGGRLGEVVPQMATYRKALQKIVDGEVDSLGDAFRIAKEALDSAEN
jgi:hypothetical protein